MEDPIKKNLKTFIRSRFLPISSLKPFPKSHLSPKKESESHLSPIIQEEESESRSSSIIQEEVDITQKPHLKNYKNDDFYILAHIYNLFEIYKDDKIALPFEEDSISFDDKIVLPLEQDIIFVDVKRKNLLGGLKRLYECLFIKKCTEYISQEFLDLKNDNIIILDCCGVFIYEKSLKDIESTNLKYNKTNICLICKKHYTNKFTISLNDIPGIKQPQQILFQKNNIDYKQHIISILLTKIRNLWEHYKPVHVRSPPYFIKDFLLKTLENIYIFFYKIKTFDYSTHNEIIILDCGHFFLFNINKDYFNNQKCPKCNRTFKNYITIKLIDFEFPKITGGENIKINKYIKYLNKFDLNKLYNIATNKKIKFTLKTSKKQIINKLVKYKFI
jgi:hypothetical protein